jgi:hypothetical protein
MRNRKPRGAARRARRRRERRELDHLWALRVFGDSDPVTLILKNLATHPQTVRGVWFDP